ncbi:hypothetical protein ACFX19_028392 [Malus domestica]
MAEQTNTESAPQENLRLLRVDNDKFRSQTARKSKAAARRRGRRVMITVTVESTRRTAACGCGGPNW